MIKYVLSLCLLLTVVSAMGQKKKSIVILVKSKNSIGIKLNGKDIIKVYEGTFRQDYSTLTSDSAYFYPQDNAFDAFGNVNINQGDTLNIYSDKLNYNGNTKIAILTDNVRMVDKDATLTTNHLTYNTATRIAVYTDGGKLVNKDNTLLSKNGYYFAFTRDSYFRYNVSLTTPDALVKTDTMRYNTGTKISYFYGPTNIYSIKKGESDKDRDTLYTENGFYNTVVEQAAFGKNNLYKSGTKSLKGDSLFYDKIKGYGRAVKHVTFEDKEQKTTIKGNLGTYFKPEERTVMTEDPYVIMVTEEKDTTNTDSVARADSIAKADSLNKGKGKGKITMNQLIKKTIPGKADATKLDQKDITTQANAALNNYDTPLNRMIADSALKKLPVQNKGKPITTDSLIKKVQAQKGSAMSTDSVLKKYGTLQNIAKADSALKNLQAHNKGSAAKADSALKKLSAQGKATGIRTADVKKGAELLKNKTTQKLTKIKDTMVAPRDTGKLKHDSIYMSADTIETQILTYKNLKIYQEKQRIAHIRDTTAKSKKPKSDVKESKFLYAAPQKLPADTGIYHRNYFGPPKAKPVAKKNPPTKRQLAIDSLVKKKYADSVALAKKMEPNDTARIRIIIAHHHFKMFKSDLQSKSDSMFYSSSDSTMRSFVHPMMWTQGSQLSGDTIFLQMKNQKLDNLKMFPNAFIANIEKTDSVHFNQAAGKRMRGYFKNDKLHRMYIEGNAESIYFSRDSGKMTISGMQRSLSSRIVIDFKNNQVTNLGFYTKPENRYAPLAKFKEDERILKGFIWKPKDRPVSKESVIPSFNKKQAVVKPPGGKSADKTKTGKPGKKPPGAKATAKDSTAVATGKLGLKTARDSILKTAPGKLPAIKTGKDSVKKADTTKRPVIKIGKDSVKKVTG